MTMFWVWAGALCLVAASFILLPLYFNRGKRPAGSRVTVNVGIYEQRLAELEESFAAGEIDREEFDSLKQELDRNLVTDADSEEEGSEQAESGTLPHRGVPVALAVLVPLFALIAYADWGFSWGAIEDYEIARELSTKDPHQRGEMIDVVRRLEKRLRSQPDNHDGWFLLGQSYMSMGMYSRAVDAFRHLEEIFPRDSNLASYLAQAMFLADNREYTPRVREMVNRTLELDPDNMTMLEIRGVGAMQEGRARDALTDFRAVLDGGAQGRRAQALRTAIAQIENQLGVEGAGAAPTEGPAGSNGSDRRRLDVRVEVKEGLDLSGDEAVFVYARALEGPPMPLAVQRLDVSSLPGTVSLDESMAMMPGMGLANFDRVQVVARISTSGIANVSPEDFQAVSDPVDLTAENSLITLRISERVGATP